ncbi:hypothetical protein ABTY98_38770 [Streptomyces sp. NPDC096040]|uniref:hypothetical protein n=1 Tax=Streptomyces sp. NPDC096040 TaxID=3155541 RepID=UPI0033314452
MAKCCGVQPCNCRVVAGTGTTVTGNGSAANPYTISADGAGATALSVQDTPTVDLTLTGTGAAGDPYEVSAAVILDPTPPQGGTNLIGSGPEGLYVECADVRGCISAGDGASYDPATGVVEARVSTDAGNSVAFGSDGGLYAPPASGGAPSVVTAGDTNTANNSVTGTGAAGDPYVVTTDVIVDPAPPAGGTNLLSAGPDGLYVECADVRQCFTAGDGAAYDPATGEISARVSADAGNTTTIGADGGLYTPAGATALEAADTPTVDVTVTGSGATGDPYQVAAAVILDPTPPGGGSNLLQESPGGLFVECADVRQCFSAGDGAAYDPATGEISARLSTDAGNTVAFGSDGGLYAAAGSGTPTALQAGDTNTVDTTVTGTGTAADPYVVEADAIVAPEPNGLEATATGLLVAPSSDEGNQLSIGGDGRLFVPPDPPLEVGCGLQGDGTAASPLAAFPIAGSQPWTADWSCDPATQSTLKCDPTSGALWTPPEHYTAADHIYQEHMNPVVSNIGVTGGWLILQPGGTPAVVAFDVPANFLGNQCRLWSYTSHVHASIDVSASSTATFELGYVYQEDGGALQVRPIEGVLTAFGAARRERYAGSVSESGFNKPAAGTLALHYFVAVRVIAGTITINSWTSDATIHTTTQG